MHFPQRFCIYLVSFNEELKEKFLGYFGRQTQTVSFNEELKAQPTFRNLRTAK